MRKLLKYFESSRRGYDELKMPQQIATAELEIADIYSELNLKEEAFEIYKRVIGEFSRYKMRREEALARANCGRAATVLGEMSFARRQLKRAVDLFRTQNNTAAQAFTRLDLARLELSCGNFQLSKELAVEAVEMFGTAAFVRHRLIADWVRAQALLGSGFVADATDILRDILNRSRKAEQGGIMQATLTSLGNIAFAAHDLGRAAAYYRRAIKAVETSRSSFGSEQFRRTFIANRLEPFEGLVKTHLAQQRFKAAFATVENFRSRTLLESIADLRGQPRVRSDQKKLQQKASELREDLNWFYKKQNDDAAPFREAKKTIGLFETELTQIFRQLESTQTKTEQPATRAKINITELQSQIGPGRAIIEFVRFDGVYSAFVVTDKKIHFVENLTTEAEIVKALDALTFQFEAMRHGAKIAPPLQKYIGARADAVLEHIYKLLVKPAENFLGERQLIVVPTGSLHHVPFHALRNGGKYLIESREIQYAPSASVWQVLNRRPKKRVKKALIVGFADKNIPLVNNEINELSRVFPQTKILNGIEASFRAFNREAPLADLIHVACHGWFRADAPMFSSLHLADGWVTVSDISAQKLKARLVTLSACETGMSRIYAGDEQLGFSRGFLSAGVNSLIVSLWKVDDAATGKFMKMLYENLQRGDSAASSIRAAQRNFIESEANPYLWSPFVLIGD